jgi:hypothetical protein
MVSLIDLQGNLDFIFSLRNRRSCVDVISGVRCVEAFGGPASLAAFVASSPRFEASAGSVCGG